MSYVDFKEVNIGNPGPADKYGANQLLELMQILNGKNVSLRRPRIANPWRWLNHMEIAAITTPANPDTGFLRLFFDSADGNKAKYVDSAGTVVDLTSATNIIDTLDELTDVVITTPAAGHVLQHNGTNWVNNPLSFTSTFNIVKAAEASIAEVILDTEVADDTSSYLRIINKSATDSRFSPGIEALANAAVATEKGLTIEALIPTAQDTGTVPVMELISRESPAAALSNRAILQISNNTTPLFTLSPTLYDFHDLLLRHILGARLKRVSSSPSTPPSTYAELYFDTDNVLKLKKDTGVVIDLESGSGGGATTLDGLTDVTVSAPANRNALLYNSGTTQWENRAIISADLPSNIVTNDVDNNLGAHYVNLAEDTDPPQPSADNARLFLSSTTGNFSIKKSNNIVVDLEAIGSQAPFVWTTWDSTSSNSSDRRHHPNEDQSYFGDDARTHIITEEDVIIKRIRVGVRSNTKNGSTVVSLYVDGIVVPNTTVTIPAFNNGHFETGSISQSIAAGSQISVRANMSSSSSGSLDYVIDTFGSYILS